MHRLGSRAAAIGSSVALVLLLVISGPAARATAAPPDQGVYVLTPVAHDVGPSLEHARQSDHAGERARERSLLRPSAGGTPSRPAKGGTPDGAVQTTATQPLGSTPGLSFDGVGVGITPTYADCCAPPDTNASVGTTQVVQWVNLDIAVFDKTTGALAAGYPKPGSSMWSTFTAGNCGTNNDGDPIVKFDAQAQRWFVTQFSVTGGPPYFQCIAVSTTADFTTTTWNRYAYSFGTSFPDYPKAGVWPDAYYLSFNMFQNGVSFTGATACAFDRALMLSGGAATGQCRNLGTGVASLLPSDLDGATGATGTSSPPPARSPSFFANFGTNALNLWKFHVDFVTSANSTFTGPTSLAVPAFSTACGGGACIPQAGTSNQLDSLGDRLMYRLAYRNFAGSERLVVTHSVTGSGTAAPRWYELTSPGTGTFAVTQASSYAPDATYRWMGSAAMDKVGNIALGYSASSTAISPGIRITGRAPGDPTSTLRIEGTIVNGSGSQTGTLHRWGDYSSMAVDPSDDCTFWYTTEYLKTSGTFNWSTRIASFKLPGCN